MDKQAGSCPLLHTLIGLLALLPVGYPLPRRPGRRAQCLRGSTRLAADAGAKLQTEAEQGRSADEQRYTAAHANVAAPAQVDPKVLAWGRHTCDVPSNNA